MKPSIGRIVHFTDGDGDAVPGIITAVHDGSVDLCIFHGTGFAFAHRVVEADENHSQGRWTWPPKV